MVPPESITMLKCKCDGCGATTDLYQSSCKHMTLCLLCGKSLVESAGTCAECSIPIRRLIKVYNVKHHAVKQNYFVGRFHQGVPHYSKRKISDTKWSMQLDGFQGRQLTDTLREKYKNKPWILEDDIGQQQFTGQLEGGQQATYYLMIMQGNDFLALPAGNWYNFHKVAHYKQLTLEEAEEQMKNRRKTADGYQRWMMKAANTGAAAFGVGESEQIGGVSGSGGRARANDDEANGADSDKGEVDEDDEEARKVRLGMNKGAAGDEDGEEPAHDIDLDDDEGERGDDWEHEETFTDDDEAVGNDLDERDDQGNPEVPPPEIKQEEEDEEEGQENPQEEPGGLSKSGKELKKLLGKAAKEDDSDGLDEDDGTDEDVDLDNEDIGMSPVLAPTRKEGPKEEPVEGTPAKAVPVSKSTPPSASAGKGKRKPSTADESKTNGGGAAKKAKSENVKAIPPSVAVKKDVTSAVKAATASIAKSAPAKVAVPANQGVTEDEVMKVLRSTGPVKSTDLVAKFRSRLRTPDDKSAFAAILKKISRIQKTDGANYIVVRAQQ